MKPISYSSLNEWLTCGEKWRLKRVEHYPSRASWWSVGGSAVHEASARMEIDNTVTLTEAWESAFGDQVERTLEESGEPVEAWQAAGKRTAALPDGENGLWWHDNGPRMIQRHLDAVEKARYATVMIDGEVAVELDLTVGLPDWGKVAEPLQVRSIIDRVYDGPNGPVIVDLKTGRRTPPSSLQLAFYALAVQRATGIAVQHAAYSMLRTGSLVEVPLAGIDVSSISRSVALFTTAVDEKIFIPNPGYLCPTCDVRSYCSYYTKESKSD